MRTFLVIIDKERCKGCALCVDFCPKHVIEIARQMNVKGQHFAKAKTPANCSGCAQCALVCPDAAIEIHATSATRHRPARPLRRKASRQRK